MVQGLHGGLIGLLFAKVVRNNYCIECVCNLRGIKCSSGPSGPSGGLQSLSLSLKSTFQFVSVVLSPGHLLKVPSLRG